MAEIDQHTQLKTGRFEVIMNLRPVLISQLLYSLEFDNDPLEAYKVWHVYLP